MRTIAARGLAWDACSPRTGKEVARRFAEALEKEGFDVWWDTALRAGEAFDQVTERALKSAHAVVVLWSKHSVDSRWLRAEATLADRIRKLKPVMIEPCDRPIIFELIHTAELEHWRGDPGDPAWRSFVDDVRGHVAQSKGSQPATTDRSEAARAPDRTPDAQSAALEGLAMLRVLQTAFTISFKGKFTLGALVTLLVTVADVPTSNVGAPFRGLVFGFAAS